MARIAEALSQTFKSFSPDGLADRLFGDSLEDWWQDYVQELAGSAYSNPVQSAFFITTFAAMGHMAKVDGRIQESEISLANSVMGHFNLHADHKRLAIRLFNEGKESDFNLESVLGRFNKSCQHRVSVLHAFIEIQLKLAFVDAALNSKEQNLLARMCKRLDIPKSVYQRIERRVAAVQSGNAAPVQPTKPMGLADACAVLGVSRWTSRQDIKLAYRRLMSQHHPDKLLARNSSKQEVEQATGKVQQIKSAYEMICKIKKFR